MAGAGCQYARSRLPPTQAHVVIDPIRTPKGELIGLAKTVKRCLLYGINLHWSLGVVRSASS